MTEISDRIEQLGLIPIIVIENSSRAVPLAEAIQAGGLPCAEVTFRTAAARESIERIRTALPDILLGAGTVLSIEQADKAVSAGARFVVSPGFNPRVVDHCLSKSIPVFPGVCTPSDLEKAAERKLEIVKFFPAEAIGGLRYLKAISAPFPKIRFIPTGGINAQNLSQYLAFPKVAACGGSWMVDSRLIRDADFGEITKRVREAVRIVSGR